eukprot:IDg7133t1
MGGGDGDQAQGEPYSSALADVSSVALPAGAPGVLLRTELGLAVPSAVADCPLPPALSGPAGVFLMLVRNDGVDTGSGVRTSSTPGDVFEILLPCPGGSDGSAFAADAVHVAPLFPKAGVWRDPGGMRGVDLRKDSGPVGPSSSQLDASSDVVSHGVNDAGSETGAGGSNSRPSVSDSEQEDLYV